MKTRKMNYEELMQIEGGGHCRDFLMMMLKYGPSMSFSDFATHAGWAVVICS